MYIYILYKLLYYIYIYNIYIYIDTYILYICYIYYILYIYIIYIYIYYVYIIYYIYYTYYIHIINYIYIYISIYTWAHQASRLDDLGGRCADQASLSEQYVQVLPRISSHERLRGTKRVAWRGVGGGAQLEAR